MVSITKSESILTQALVSSSTYFNRHLLIFLFKVFGGNDANCGTWMDKMGSSVKAKTKGIPSSPRDGSAVELVGLQASVLRFLEKSSDYPYKTVERKNVNSSSTVSWTFKEWADKIEQNFEKFFYVSDSDTSPLVHKRRIYKDTVSFG